MNLYTELESGRRQMTRSVARVLWMTLEHESWHTEVWNFYYLYDLNPR
jgi:hypothetical protein